MAPTRPLVKQQKSAMLKFVPLDPELMVELTGTHSILVECIDSGRFNCNVTYLNYSSVLNKNRVHETRTTQPPLEHNEVSVHDAADFAQRYWSGSGSNGLYTPDDF